jgi:hypothetical protein
MSLPSECGVSLSFKQAVGPKRQCPGVHSNFVGPQKQTTPLIPTGQKPAVVAESTMDPPTCGAMLFRQKNSNPVRDENCAYKFVRSHPSTVQCTLGLSALKPCDNNFSHVQIGP